MKVKHTQLLKTITLLATLGSGIAGVIHASAEFDGPTQMSESAKKAPFNREEFRSDPDYGEQNYDPSVEKEMYRKWPVEIQQPLVELGRQMYRRGAFDRASNIFGTRNLTAIGSDFSIDGHDILKPGVVGRSILIPQTFIYGDLRTAFAYNRSGGSEQSQIATRLNLDLDVRLTATERIHAFFTPISDDGKFTRFEFGGDNNKKGKFESKLEPVTLFFEGDLARMWEGASDNLNTADIPFAVGRMPLFFQNGTWFFDVFTGAAVTLPARNSKRFGISNMDITVFTGQDEVTTLAISDDSKAKVYGGIVFIEAHEGYFEGGYGFTEGQDEFSDLDYHNIGASYTRRYFGRISNSTRLIANFGQDPNAGKAQTADGFMLLFDNSLITSNPVGFVPYLNGFYGSDKPRQLMGNSILGNTGILFESDALTGYPTLDGTGEQKYGGALGIEWLWGMDYEATSLDRKSYIDHPERLGQQLVLEAATVQPVNQSGAEQYGVGLRYQRSLTNSWLMRVDGMYGFLEQNEDVAGARLELRRKF